MCRDRGYTPTKHEHILRWKVGEDDYFVTTYNQIAGGPGLPVVLYDGVEKKNTSVDAIWGIVPIWAKSKEEGLKEANRFVNARVESVEESNVYKPLFERGQRCLIPCTHYFEHHWLEPGNLNTKKIPFAVKKRDDNIFSTPGLYATWTDYSTGEILLSYTMLTTPANALLKRVHNGGEHAGRMPLVIQRDMEKVWLDPGSSEKELREVMKYKIPARQLKTWPVHTIRGKHARTGPDVLDEWKEYSHVLKEAS